MNTHAKLTTAAHSSWQAENSAAIKARLAEVLTKQDVGEIIPSENQGVFLRLNETVLELYCYDPATNALSDIMSRIDLTNPLFLHATYLRSQMLCVCRTHSPPDNIYIAGFGGGRLGMVLHHCFEQVKIDGSEFDPAILSLCESHFGLELKDRFDVRVKDAAEDLAQRDSHYDVIILDTFTSDGVHPDHLGTDRFLKLCDDKLAKDGVVVTNLVEMDPHLDAKISAIQKVFNHCLIWEDYRSRVVFGSQTRIDIKALSEHALALETKNGLQFPLAKQCEKLRVLEPFTR